MPSLSWVVTGNAWFEATLFGITLIEVSARARLFEAKSLLTMVNYALKLQLYCYTAGHKTRENYYKAWYLLVESRPMWKWLWHLPIH
jgi:hypothetical protein